MVGGTGFGQYVVTEGSVKDVVAWPEVKQYQKVTRHSGKAKTDAAPSSWLDEVGVVDVEEVIAEAAAAAVAVAAAEVETCYVTWRQLCSAKKKLRPWLPMQQGRSRLKA